MFGHSSVDGPVESALVESARDEEVDGATQEAVDTAADKRAAKAAKVEAALAAKATKLQAKSAGKAAKQDRKTAKAESKLRRSEAKAQKAASEAAADAAAKAATGPARLVDRLTDPKTAKRAVGVGKVVAPALAPYAIKAAVSARGFLDQQRAHRLGVSVDEVAAFRGPTGATGARISGLVHSIDDLASRKAGDLQVTRFADVSRTRLGDLTTAVQASASMPRPRRSRVLRAINRELDQISADLMTHLIGTSAA